MPCLAPGGTSGAATGTKCSKPLRCNADYYFAKQYGGERPLSPKTAVITGLGNVAKFFRGVGLVAKSVVKKNWATRVLSPDIAKAQTLKNFLVAGRR
jgi:hypothetical protein